MLHTVREPVHIGERELNFLADEAHGVDSVVMFEFTVPPHARVPAPHYHRDVDEVLYGLDGDGQHAHALRAGDSIVIPRGRPHHHENRDAAIARALVVLTPGTISRRYFEEIAAVVNAPGRPDPAVVDRIMRRYGLIPA